MRIKNKIFILNFWNAKKMVLLILFGFSVLTIFSRPISNDIKLKNVIIYGESNVMNFWLKFSGETVLNSSESTTHFPLETSMQSFQRFELPIDGFSAQNNQIKKDFSQMVQAEKYPSIFIQLENNFFDQIPTADNKHFVNVLIEIGGIQKEIRVLCESINLNQNSMVYKGVATINLSDFELIPPSKLLGLIKVKEKIIITFEVQKHNS